MKYITILGEGQSNFGPPLLEKQIHDGNGLVLDANDQAFRPLEDPTVIHQSSNGSIWPLVGTLLEEATGRPLRLITTSKGSTGLVGVDWDSDLPGYWYKVAVSRMRFAQSLGVFKPDLVLWEQGERSAEQLDTTYAYRTALERLRMNFNAACEFDVPWIVNQTGAHQENLSNPTRLDPIRLAQRQIWDYSRGFLPGVVAHDRRDIHWETNAEAATLTGRTYCAIMDALGYTTFGRGPRIMSVKVSGIYLTVTYSRDLSPDGLLTAGGFTIAQTGGTARTVIKAEVSGERQVTLTLSGVLDGTDPTLTFASGHTTRNGIVPRSRAIPLPRPIHGVPNAHLAAEPEYGVKIV